MAHTYHTPRTPFLSPTRRTVWRLSSHRRPRPRAATKTGTVRSRPHILHRAIAHRHAQHLDASGAGMQRVTRQGISPFLLAHAPPPSCQPHAEATSTHMHSTPPRICLQASSSQSRPAKTRRRAFPNASLREGWQGRGGRDRTGTGERRKRGRPPCRRPYPPPLALSPDLHVLPSSRHSRSRPAIDDGLLTRDAHAHGHKHRRGSRADSTGGAPRPAPGLGRPPTAAVLGVGGHAALRSSQAASMVGWCSKNILAMSMGVRWGCPMIHSSRVLRDANHASSLVGLTATRRAIAASWLSVGWGQSL